MWLLCAPRFIYLFIHFMYLTLEVCSIFVDLKLPLCISCVFSFVARGAIFFSAYIVLCVGGCIFFCFLFFELLLGVCVFVRASRCFVCVLLQTIVCRRFLAVFPSTLFCCTKSCCQIGECVSDFFKPLLPHRTQSLLSMFHFCTKTMSVCRQIRDSASFICQRAVCICMLSPST